MKTKALVAGILLCPVFALLGCSYATGSAEIGNSAPRTQIGPREVIIYLKPPPSYTEIGTVHAESEMSPTLHGGPLGYAAEELKRQAAKIGANGLIQVRALRHSSAAYGPVTDDMNMKDIRLTAVAISVPASTPIEDSSVLMSKMPGLHPPAWSPPDSSGEMRLVAKGPQDLAPDVSAH